MMFGDTSPASKHMTHIKGVVEVVCTMRGKDAQERVRVAHVCKEAVLNFQAASSAGVQLDGGITGNLEAFNSEGYVVVNGPCVQVLDPEMRSVSIQMAPDISTIAALRDSNGLLVIIGKCQLRNKRVGVVLDMFSDQNADLVIDDYQNFKDKRVVGVVHPQPPNTLNDRPLPVPTPQRPQIPEPTWPPSIDNDVGERGISVKQLRAKFSTANSTATKPILQEFVPINQNYPSASQVPPQKLKPSYPPMLHENNLMRRGSLDAAIPYQPRRPSLPEALPPMTKFGAVPTPLVKFNPILPERLPDDPVPAPPGTTFPSSNANEVLQEHDGLDEDNAQEYYADPDDNNERETYVLSTNLPQPTPVNNGFPSRSSAYNSQIPSFSEQGAPPPRPPKNSNAIAKLAQIQRQDSIRSRTESVGEEESASGSYDLQNRIMTEDGEVMTFPPQPTYGDLHQPSKYNAKKGDILYPRGYVADIKRVIKKFGNIAMQNQMPKDSEENSQENIAGRYDFQVEDPSDEDNIPVLRNFRPLPSSPVPKTNETTRLSVSSDSSGLSESTEEPEYVGQETYYGSLGISIEDSERIYMNRPIRRTNRYSKPPESLGEDIICFILEENKHFQNLERINKAREEMSPMLQNLLRKTMSLVQVHLRMNSELKNCTDSCLKIAQVLLKYKDQLEAYIYYVMKAPEINKMLDDLSEDFLKKYPGIKDDIRSSWKRFNFYILTLEQFQKNAPEGDKPSIARALEMLRDLSKRADTEILLDGIKGAPYPLHTLGVLLLHNSFTVTGPLLKKDFTIRVLLFHRTIVITQHKSNKYDFLLDIPVTQSYFTHMKQENEKSFSLEVNLGGIQGKRQYIFQAPSKDVKEAWVSEIQRIMHGFAEAEKKELAKRDAT